MEVSDTVSRLPHLVVRTSWLWCGAVLGWPLAEALSAVMALLPDGSDFVQLKKAQGGWKFECCDVWGCDAKISLVCLFLLAWVTASGELLVLACVVEEGKRI